MPAAPESLYPSPVIGTPPAGGGLTFPADGSGLTFDAGYPLTFAPETALDLQALFPTVIPAVEKIVYQHVLEACSARTIFPTDGSGLSLPFSFGIPPDLGLYKTSNGSGTLIPVVRGWPAYPGKVPAIGVAEATTNDDAGEDMIFAGFVGDVEATDDSGNVLATAAYYAQPLQIVVVVELIHENRDERDRLHDQLRRVMYPLRHLIPSFSAQARDVRIDSEKQDLPQDELPRPIYVSLYTVTVAAEALIPTEITPTGVIDRIDITVTPTS